jgi:hypothetical protein
MSYYSIAYCYLLGEFLPVATGAYNFRKLDLSAKIIWLMVTFSLLGELAAFYAATAYHNNLPVYNISSICELLILCTYFNRTIKKFRKFNVGYLIGVGSLVVAAITIVFGHPLTKVNNYFMVYQGLLVILMCLIYLSQLLLLPGYIHLKYEPNYWFSLLLIFFWSVTILNWAFYDYLYIHFYKFQNLLNYTITIIALLTSFGFAVVFFFYPKMIRNAGA